MAPSTRSGEPGAAQDVPRISSANSAMPSNRPSLNPLSQGPCRRCCYHLGRWKEGMEKPSCTSTSTASNKCSRCVRENKKYEGGKLCLYMDPGHRSICRRLETEIAEPFPNIVEVRRLQVLCRKYLQEYKCQEKKQGEKGKSKAERPAQEDTPPTASVSTPEAIRLGAQELLSSQVRLDIANSLHSLSCNLAAMAQHFGVRDTVTVPARECPSSWDGILQAEDDLVNGISEEVEEDGENEEGLFVEEDWR
ncbi:hypothetical protein GGI43DRAFT_432672 [Trichoderma evansii]